MGKTIQLEDREVELNFEELDSLPLEEILTINYSNIKNDIATFPFIVNQLGFLLTDANNILRKEELQLEILQTNMDEFKASTFIEVKKNLIENGEKSPTITLVESQLKLQDGYKSLQESILCQKQKIIEAQKNKDYLNNMYWSAQSKMNSLISLSKNNDLIC